MSVCPKVSTSPSFNFSLSGDSVDIYDCSKKIHLSLKVFSIDEESWILIFSDSGKTSWRIRSVFWWKIVSMLDSHGPLIEKVWNSISNFILEKLFMHYLQLRLIDRLRCILKVKRDADEGKTVGVSRIKPKSFFLWLALLLFIMALDSLNSRSDLNISWFFIYILVYGVDIWYGFLCSKFFIFSLCRKQEFLVWNHTGLKSQQSKKH